MSAHDRDHLSRTVLLALHTGEQPSVAAAIERQEQTGVHIIADTETCTSASGQAATLSAVATAVRAFGQVHVSLGSPDTTLIGGFQSGRTIGEQVEALGARVGPGPTTQAGTEQRHPSGVWPHLCLGASTPPPQAAGAAAPTLRADWTGWTAKVTPVSPAAVETAISNKPASTGRRRGQGSSRDVCVLAAMAAAALAVAEAFLWTRAAPGSDAGYRPVELNLWAPGQDRDDGPTLSYAPASWWLVGLGHLGQAYAWVISWLAYADPSAVEIVVQDTDRTTPANHSTGLLTPEGSDKVMKTRLVAAALERCEHTVRIVERRVDAHQRVGTADTHVALLGVDNLCTRRLTSAVGWRLAIDAGLGSRADFASILIRRFPGAIGSADVPGWQDRDPGPTSIPNTQAFTSLANELDTCGLAELAGTAVGASFVGVVAACLAVAEAVRELHGGRGLDVLAVDLDSGDIAQADAHTPANVVALPLRPTLSGVARGNDTKSAGQPEPAEHQAATI